MVLSFPDIASASTSQDFAWVEITLTTGAYAANTPTPAYYFVDLNSFVNFGKKPPSGSTQLLLGLASPATSLSTEYANGLV